MEPIPADTRTIPQINPEKYPDQPEICVELANRALALAWVNERLSLTYRGPIHSDGSDETVSGHSHMVALLAPEVATLLNQAGYTLDPREAGLFGSEHDLLEALAGDPVTFGLTPEQLAAKQKREHAKSAELLEHLPKYTADRVRLYEDKATLEAVVTNAVDKWTPVLLDIIGDGVRVMAEKYGVRDLEELKKFHTMMLDTYIKRFGKDGQFGQLEELVGAYKILIQEFEEKFAAADLTEYNPTKERPKYEVERKFLIDPSDIPPEIELDKLKRSRIRQGYINIGEDGSEIRVRSYDDNRYELTKKSAGSTTRREETIVLSDEEFEIFWAQTEGQRIEKTRYYLNLDNILENGVGDDLVAEIDIYDGDLSGLCTVEVDFLDQRPADAETKALAFTDSHKPTWFGADVSNNRLLKNQSLARMTKQQLDEQLASSL
ncbi:hypothetical protein CR969_01055 [Candidatus Saccharibacteria bacterium]|nr:MAG: hypothetical protein CR969_01055 [Candidatus Saccharibacteria bacterium]